MRHSPLLVALLFFRLLDASASTGNSVQPQNPVAGSPERHAVCNGFELSFMDAYVSIVNGSSAEYLMREFEIKAAGHNFDERQKALAYFGYAMVEYYAKSQKAPSEMSTDFLSECLPRSGSLAEVLTSWAENVLPAEHSILSLLAPASDNGDSTTDDLDLQPDSSLAPDSYHALLGDDFFGTQALSFYEKRIDGQLDACGLDLSHTLYDDKYANGQPVKLSGSILISPHPVDYLVSMAKIKAELMTIEVERDEPSSQLSVIELDAAYTLNNGFPILEKTRSYKCEDTDYLCHIVYPWERVAKAIFYNNLGIGFRPSGAGSDIVVKLDLSNLPEFAGENLDFSICINDLLLANYGRSNPETNN